MRMFKDAMPVSFDQSLTLNHTHYFRKSEKLPNIVLDNWIKK